MFNNHFKKIFFLLLFVSPSLIFFSGCSSNSALPSFSATDKKMGFKASAGLDNTGKNIFSNNAELSYIESNEIYKINVGDKLTISVYQADELSKKATVNSQGNITFPLIGRFHAQGLSQEEAEQKLTTMLGEKYLQDPQVSISVSSKTNEKVTLEGWVKKPGIFPLEGSITLLQSIALAQGLNDLADPSKVILFRKATGKAYLLSLEDIRAGKARDPYVKANDRIIVSKSGTRSFIKDASTILGGVFAPLRSITY